MQRQAIQTNKKKREPGKGADPFACAACRKKMRRDASGQNNGADIAVGQCQCPDQRGLAGHHIDQHKNCKDRGQNGQRLGAHLRRHLRDPQRHQRHNRDAGKDVEQTHGHKGHQPRKKPHLAAICVHGCRAGQVRCYGAVDLDRDPVDHHVKGHGSVDQRKGCEPRHQRGSGNNIHKNALRSGMVGTFRLRLRQILHQSATADHAFLRNGSIGLPAALALLRKTP